MADRELSGTMSGRNPSHRGRRVADVFATAAMGSWIVLAVMPVIVVIVALA